MREASFMAKSAKEDLIIGLLVILIILQVYGLFFHRQVVTVDGAAAAAGESVSAPASQDGGLQIQPPAPQGGAPQGGASQGGAPEGSQGAPASSSQGQGSAKAPRAGGR